MSCCGLIHVPRSELILAQDRMCHLQESGQAAWSGLSQALPLLRHLSMGRSWYMGLPEEPDELWQLTKLERLAFGTCQCDQCESPTLDLDKAGGMSNLTHLALSSDLSNPDSVTKLTNLVTLDLARGCGGHVSFLPLAHTSCAGHHLLHASDIEQSAPRTMLISLHAHQAINTCP